MSGNDLHMAFLTLVVAWLWYKSMMSRGVSAKFLCTAKDPRKWFKLPQHHHEGDAGYDLSCSEDAVIKPHSFNVLHTNTVIAAPPNTWFMITARSSTKDRGLIVLNGIIDNGWRGELFVTVWNTTDEDVVVKKGDRLVQVIFFNLVTPRCVPVSLGAMTDGDRGENGFGSTGK